MIAPTSFFSDYGGHIRILEEARALQALGHRLTIVTYYKGKDVAGLTIHRTPPLPWRPDFEVGSSRHKVAFDVYLAARAFALMRQLKPDIVHGHMHEGALIGGPLARLWGVPLVFDFQGSLTGEMVDHAFLNPDGVFYPWLFRLERFISRRLPQAILTSSGQALSFLVDRCSVPPERIHPLPDCANLALFAPDRYDLAGRGAIRQRLGLRMETPVVAYLGLLTDYQGTDHLVRLAAIIKELNQDVRFLIMGFPNVDHYRSLAERLGVSDRIVFTGRVDYVADAPGYLAAADITIATKMSATEGSGKVLNYMAMAKPVVAYDTPVHREYLGDLGRYAPVGDIRGLANQILALTNDPAERSAIGSALRERAATAFSWDAAGRRIESVYRSLTTHSAGV
jgi:glycosyltransferase involved in cell wall biosynthesis